MKLEDRSRLQVWSRLAGLIGIMCLLPDFALARSPAQNHPDASDLGAKARQATIAIFRDRDSTAIDRYFSEPFVQHHPNIGDGLTGLRAFLTELANSPTTNVTIYRTVVDGDIVMLHSKYEGWPGFSGPVIVFDLFRFKYGKIV
jgi:predicted SnoaL-like aldol condensation-catalyzing enzyme